MASVRKADLKEALESLRPHVERAIKKWKAQSAERNLPLLPRAFQLNDGTKPTRRTGNLSNFHEPHQARSCRIGFTCSASPRCCSSLCPSAWVRIASEPAP